MNNEELQAFKRKISEQTGVPLPLLTGETPEENIALARALLALRAQNEKGEPKAARDRFAEELQAAGFAGGYERPAIKSHKSTREQFADWTAEKGYL